MIALKLSKVSKSYGTQKAVIELNFELNKGEVVGFLGPNGAGKSTTMKLIAGIIQPDVGTIEINGVKIDHSNNTFKKSIGYLPENNPLYVDLYVKESLDFFAKLHQLQNARQDIEQVIEACGLTAVHAKKISELSKGYKQRVGIAQALLHKPDLFILDEATTGLDPNQILEIRELIKSLGKDRAVLISTHILQEVESICTRCIVLNKGIKIADSSIEDLKKSIHQKYSVAVKFDVPISLDYLRSFWSHTEHDTLSDEYTIFGDNPNMAKDVYVWSVQQQIVLTELRKKEYNLEDVFKLLTK